MRTEIQRYRLRASGPSAGRPWRRAYVVPAHLFPQLYTLFGPCFSHRYGAGHRPPVLSRSDYGTLKRSQVSGDYIIVVLVRRLKNNRVVSWVPPRLADAERHTPIKRHMAALARVIEPLSATLHLGPGAEGIHSMCGLCRYADEHLLGFCTPGLARCVDGITLPPEHLYRKRSAT